MSEKRPLPQPLVDPQVTPKCPRDVSDPVPLCQCQVTETERRRGMSQDPPSTHLCVSGVAAACRGRSLVVGRDHFKFGGGALHRKGVRDCLREYHFAPLGPRDRAGVRPGSPSAHRLHPQGNSTWLPVSPHSRIPSRSARTPPCDMKSRSPPRPVSSSVKRGCGASDLELLTSSLGLARLECLQIPVFLKATYREIRGPYPLWTDEETESTSLVHAKEGSTDPG